jgi:glycosyltransferase involved in cell wall biosynthesis
MLVFSKDRPLQLDGLLRSWQRHCRDAAAVPVRVLYKASSSRLLSYYRRLMADYPEVDFVREGDFRRDVLVLLRGQKHVLFAVDDTVFVRDFRLADGMAILDSDPSVLGVSLRLGHNTVSSYMARQPQKLPEFDPLPGGFLKYRWPGAEHDFGYPLELSSSIYRAAEMRQLLEAIEFKNPNTMEDNMWHQAQRFHASHPVLACPEQSLAFSIPVNKVQEVCDNRAGASAAFSADKLAGLFKSGHRMMVEALDGVVPNACHQEVEIKTAPLAEPVPLVTVIMPCYNQAGFLPEAVASVVAQTMGDWEIIIVNDGSPDNTSEVARALAKQHTGRRVRLLEKKNGGLANARNAGIAMADGAYILPLDADDKIDPVMLEKTAGLLESDPKLAIAYTDIAHFGVVEKVIQAAEFDFKKIVNNNQLNYCSLYRREAWESVGGYRSWIYGYEDWDFWIACAERGWVARRIPGPLLLYRVKDASMFTVAVKHDRELRARIILNHPALYEPKQRAEAPAIWVRQPLPPPPGLPKVSVVIPTRDRPAFLARALQSVVEQTMRDFEIIVVNDRGIDVSSVIARFASKARITYLPQPTGNGIAAARNNGMRAAAGKYIAHLDDDDLFLPDHLETLVNFLESTGNKVAYTDANCAEEEWADGEYRVTKRGVQYSADWDNDRILVQNFVPTLCFMHDRLTGIVAGEFDEELSTHEDWEYWIRLGRAATPVHIKKVTCEFRRRKDGSSMTSGHRADFLRTIRMVYKKHQALAAGNETIRAQQAKFLRGLEEELGASVKERGFGDWLRGLFGGRRGR